MIDGEAGTRIYHEVIIHKVIQSRSDTAEEAKYRAEVVEAVRKIEAEGGVPEPLKEIL